MAMFLLMVPVPTISTPTPIPAGGINESDLSLACMAMFLLTLPLPTNSTPTPDPAGGINESNGCKYFTKGTVGQWRRSTCLPQSQ